MNPHEQKEQKQNVQIGIVMLALSVIGLVLPHGIFRSAIAIILMVVALRGALSIWTLGFVRPERLVEEVQRRVPLLLLAGIGLMGGLTILSH